MKITEDFTGALLVREVDTKNAFILLVFEDGSLEHSEDISARNFENAIQQAKQILEDESYEDKELVPDYEGCFEMLVGEILDNERIVFELSSSDEDEDDYDGSLASYLSDPAHWPD